jgi:hypothetical protein
MAMKSSANLPAFASRSKPRLVPLAELLDGCMSEALAKQGFAGSDVISSWPEIVGEPLATHSQPLRMEWPRRRRGQDPEARPDPATLVVRVESAFALDLQQTAPLVIERVNAHYGWACVGKIVIRQGPVKRAPMRVAEPLPPDPAILREVEGLVADVEDDGLKAALARFGCAVLGAREKPESKTNTKA